MFTTADLKAFDVQETVSRQALFSVHFILSHQLRDLIIRAETAIKHNDYVSYSWCKSDFDDISSAIKSPVFADWERNNDRRDFPQFSFTDWLDRRTIESAYVDEDELFCDGSLISKCDDVPF